MSRNVPDAVELFSQTIEAEAQRSAAFGKRVAPKEFVEDFNLCMRWWGCEPDEIRCAKKTAWENMDTAVAGYKAEADYIRSLPEYGINERIRASIAAEKLSRKAEQNDTDTTKSEGAAGNGVQGGSGRAMESSRQNQAGLIHHHRHHRHWKRADAGGADDQLQQRGGAGEEGG
jgi:hypothetical protein